MGTTGIGGAGTVGTPGTGGTGIVGTTGVAGTGTVGTAGIGMIGTTGTEGRTGNAGTVGTTTGSAGRMGVGRGKLGNPGRPGNASIGLLAVIPAPIDDKSVPKLGVTPLDIFRKETCNRRRWHNGRSKQQTRINLRRRRNLNSQSFRWSLQDNIGA